MHRLNGKVALITGSSRGMGESHARVFVEHGAKVIMTDVDEVRGSAIARELGENAIFLRHDVTDEAQWTTIVEHAEQAFGPVNVLVNNAGILGPIAKTAELTETDYMRVCAANQHSVFLGMKSVIPSMIRAGIGSIVNISSIAGMAANVGFPSVAYVGSKFAVRGMTKAAAIEYACYNIRANSIHPGYIQTPMMIEATDEQSREAVLPLIPLGRMANAREVSMLAMFLASDESSYITGSEHLVDAGMLAQ
jgi:3alpha(or 20beta)-hydroxysteroid dehydrogenase